MKGRYGDACRKHAPTCRRGDAPGAGPGRVLGLVRRPGGYADAAPAVEAGLDRGERRRAAREPDGRLAFFDLSTYVAALRRDLGPDRWAARRSRPCGRWS